MTRSLSLAMRRYSVPLRDQIFVKGYGFLSFARNIGKNIGEYISKSLSSKKLLNYAKQSATDALKTASKGAIQKTAETMGDLIGNKIADTKVSKTSPQNNSVINEEEILRESYISPEEKQKIIDDLRLI